MKTNVNIPINRSVKILTNENKLQITKAYAESNLSKSALKYADKTDTHYLFEWGRTSYIVIYELPVLFNRAFNEVLRFLIVYCMPYAEENNLTDSVIYERYLNNYKKELKK